MGLLQYREVDWDDLGGDAQPPTMSWREFLAWCSAVLVVFALILFFLPLRDLLLSPGELAAKYPRSYAWLNRCDTSCERDVNIDYLALQRQCSGLVALYSDDRQPRLLSWRLAVDDRASALGCEGFPHELRAIHSSVVQVEQNRGPLLEQARWEREQNMLDAQAQTVTRYEQSLAEGDLLQFVSRIVQDPSDPGIVTLTTAPAWDRLPASQRAQIQDVLWQKWALIHSPTEPEQSRIILNAQE
ncbi:MAG: hypothetical protein PHU04_05165 [Candidatus Peribacteraceae bacterium]|nr:hypothetical protein [Candidatus Peribacteraceae bacterium]